MPIELFGDIKDVAPGLGVVDQDQIEFAAFGGVEEFALVAQEGEQFAVAVDTGLQALELADQRARRVGVIGIEGFELFIQQVIEIERGMAGLLGWTGYRWLESAPSFGFSARYEGPADVLRVLEQAGLDGFVFGKHV